jgi:hypothetical protein
MRERDAAFPVVLIAAGATMLIARSPGIPDARRLQRRPSGGMQGGTERGPHG